MNVLYRKCERKVCRLIHSFSLKFRSKVRPILKSNGKSDFKMDFHERFPVCRWLNANGYIALLGFLLIQ